MTLKMKMCFDQSKKINDCLHEAKKLRSGSHDTSSVKSKSSRHSTGSYSSSSSAKLRLIEARAKAAALQVEAGFLKEKQALRMATEDLELRQKIAEIKAEENEEFDEEQNNDSMNDYLEDAKAKLTYTPFLLEAKYNCQTTLKVPSVKFQGSALVSKVATTPSVTKPIFVSTASMNPTVQPFVSSNLPIKEEEHREEYGTPTDTKLIRNDKEERMYTFERHPSRARPDQDYLDIQRKQAELSQMIVTQQARSLLTSHEPPTFFGEVMSYPAFIEALKTLKESKVYNSRERLYFLDQYTSGKAKELIKCCLQMKSGS